MRQRRPHARHVTRQNRFMQVPAPNPLNRACIQPRQAQQPIRSIVLVSQRAVDPSREDLEELSGALQQRTLAQ